MSEHNKKDNTKRQLLATILGVIALLVLVNIAAYRWFAQLDLTKDQRYSVTPTTQQFLKSIKGKVHVQVFLKGDYLPAAFKNLSNSTEELLRTFRNKSDNHIAYTFTDPLENEASINTLGQYGMTGIPVTISGKTGSEQKMIFPWALVNYQPENGGPERVMPVFLQESNSMVLSKTILNRSETLLEYNLANAIHQLQKGERDAIAYLTGNGEAFGPEIIGTFAAIGAQYSLDSLNLQSVTAIDPKYKTVIINRPFAPFSDVDLFKIDQYIMQGGSVLFAVDAVRASIDSFSLKETFTAMPVDTRLNEILFKYGARINSDIVLDAANNAGIPVASGGQAQEKMFSWPYFPILQGNENNVITKNLNGVLARFASSIDINKNNEKIIKTPLLTTSQYSKTEGTPAAIMYKSVLDEPNPATFTKKNLVVAALLEGNFVSAFLANTPEAVDAFMTQNNLQLKTANPKGKVIVVSDADIFINEVSQKSGPMELGKYRFNQGFTFDNRAFLQNCLAYLSDENNLLSARTKNLENRILDPKRVSAERGNWQIINIVVPAILVLLFAAAYGFFRKRKYTSK